ncbi:hypothetical protein FK521_27400 [Klebsiella pneumoniae]|nr:hypothetical protein [Klebsiella pneumoniae]
MRIALADNRRCFIMLFSSEVVHYELTSESGLEQAIRFLSQRFRGGTMRFDEGINAAFVNYSYSTDANNGDACC